MSFKDIFKKSFLETFARYDMSKVSIIMTFVITILFALYIFFIYRMVTKRTFYSKSFNIALCLTTLITSAVIMTIQSSVVVSLGMVGALSIVRFRTAIKDPMDLAFLFWAISTGIICGAGLAEIALPLAIVLTLAIVLLDKIPLGRAPKILMVGGEGYEVEHAVMEVVAKHCAYASIKSRSLANDHTDLVVALRMKAEQEPELMKEISQLPHVASSCLLAHDGEVTL